jgi:acetyltransferase-like isoleucine patch superfamily enzyme
MGGYCDVAYKFKAIGKNVEIGRNVYFRYPEEIVIGNNVIIDDFCYFTTSASIGSYIHVASHCSVIGGVRARLVMKDFSCMAAGCRIVCSSDDFIDGGVTNPTVPDVLRSRVTIGSVCIEKFAGLGTGVVVHQNVVIGEGTMVGSMSLVTKSLAPWGVYIGQPAKFHKSRSQDMFVKNKHKFDALLNSAADSICR